MKNITNAIMDIGDLIRGWGSSIDHRTYRDICNALASLVESANGDITNAEYVDWWSANISYHKEDW